RGAGPVRVRLPARRRLRARLQPCRWHRSLVGGGRRDRTAILTCEQGAWTARAGGFALRRPGPFACATRRPAHADCRGRSARPRSRRAGNYEPTLDEDPMPLHDTPEHAASPRLRESLALAVLVRPLDRAR